MEYRLEGELCACPSCGGENVEHLDFLPADRWRRKRGEHLLFITGCNSCGLMFVNPPPSAEEIAEIYKPDGAWNEVKSHGDLTPDEDDPAGASGAGPAWNALVEEIATLAADRLQRPSPEISILDFGCGRGWHLDLLAAKGFKTFGLDPATKHYITAHTMLDVVPTTPSFDVILVNHVVEHMIDPLSTLRTLRAALKPDGFLVFGVPSLNGLQDHRKFRYCINADHHLTAYTERSTRALMAVAGLNAEVFWSPVPHRLRCVATLSPAPHIGAPLDEGREALHAFRRTDTEFPITTNDHDGFRPARDRATERNNQLNAAQEERKRHKRMVKDRPTA